MFLFLIFTHCDLIQDLILMQFKDPLILILD